jgi:uncharacterized protein YeaO (DUF488 family)
MKSKIEIFTSYIEESNIEKIKSMNLLPVFVIRSMGRLEYIERWAGTPLHFRELAPSKELFREYKAGNIDLGTYFKRFVIELADIDFQNIILRLENLVDSSGADGICLCGLGVDPSESHRSIVSDILWRTGYLEFEPREL